MCTLYTIEIIDIYYFCDIHSQSVNRLVNTPDEDTRLECRNVVNAIGLDFAFIVKPELSERNWLP